MVRLTSYSVSESGLAPTLIWMLIWGGFACGCSDVGAFGFSKERALVYCARTLSWGGASAVGGVPLPSVMKSSPGAKKRRFGRVANIALPPSTRIRPGKCCALLTLRLAGRAEGVRRPSGG